MFEDMRFAVIVPPEAPLSQLRPLWHEIEAAGFDDISVPDTPLLMRDGFVSLAALAHATTDVGLMMSITNTLTRDATVMAGMITALHDLAPGRLRIGFGAGDSSTYGVGLGGASPAAMEEYIVAVRAVLAGQDTKFRGRTLHPAWHNWEPTPVPFLIASHGERSMRMAGRVGDGVISGFGLTPETLARSEELLSESGRRDELEVWNLVPVAGGATVEEAFMYSGMGGGYQLARNGFKGKQVPEEHHEALRKLYATFSLKTHSYANHEGLEVAQASGLMEYLIDRSGGLFGPVDYVERIQRLRDRGAKNLLFSPMGADKVGVTRELAKAISHRGARRLTPVGEHLRSAATSHEIGR